MTSEPRKTGAVRRELCETNAMLRFLLKSIDLFNDDNEAPMCPEGCEACVGDCVRCWIDAAFKEVRREEA